MRCVPARVTLNTLGGDATASFEALVHSPRARSILATFLIGSLTTTLSSPPVSARTPRQRSAILRRPVHVEQRTLGSPVDVERRLALDARATTTPHTAVLTFRVLGDTPLRFHHGQHFAFLFACHSQPGPN